MINDTLNLRVGNNVINDECDYNQAITRYRQKVGNLSLSQKIFIAAMTFLGALLGFIVGAVIGGVVSVGNPLGILAGSTTGIIIGASLGTVAGGSLGLLLSRLGMFKYDPIKPAANELAQLIEDCANKLA